MPEPTTATSGTIDSELEKGGNLPNEPVKTAAAQSGTESPAQEAPKPTPPTFPEGGKDAWIVVFGAFLAVFVSFGMLNAFGGEFQTYYKAHQLEHETESNISWIGSFQAFCIYIMGSVFGALFDKYGARPILFAGGIGFSFSMMMQSLCKDFWQFFLAQGLLQGFCLSALFAPSFACVNHWFSKRRGFAIGIVTSGSSVGGVVWPIAANRLIQEVGFGWALRTMGFIAFALTMVSTVLVKPRLPKRTGRDFFALELFRKPAYTFFCGGAFFTILGIFFLIFYLPTYGAAHGFDDNLVFYSAAVLNAGSFFGRIVPGIMADLWGCFNVLITTAFICALLVFCSIAATNSAGILVIGALYGFMSGNVLSLVGACIPPLLDNPSTIGVAIGQMLSVCAFAALLGPPIAGWLIAFNGFVSAQIFAGVMIAFGSCLLIVTRTYLSKPGARLIV